MSDPLAVRIRRSTEADVGAMAAIYLSMAEHHAALDPARYRVPDRDAVVARFRAELAAEEPDDLHLVAEVDGRVLGQLDAIAHPARGAGSMRVPRRGASIGIGVHESARGRGIGTALMRAAEDWAREQGLEVLELDVAEPNADARRLYERLGYVPIAASLARRLQADDTSGRRDGGGS